MDFSKRASYINLITCSVRSHEDRTVLLRPSIGFSLLPFRMGRSGRTALQKCCV